MTIKQLGGVFGRNPTFNDVTIEGTLTFDGGIDITSDLTVDGTVTADGLTVEQSTTDALVNFKNTNASTSTQTSSGLALYHNSGSGYAQIVSKEIDVSDNFADLQFYYAGGTGGAPKLGMQIASNGDISFYEDTGTTAKLFWDASEEQLNINSSQNNYAQIITQSNVDGSSGGLYIQKTAGGSRGLLVDTTGSYAAATAAFIGHNVGIGTTSPDQIIHAYLPSGTARIKAETAGATDASQASFQLTTPNRNWQIVAKGSDNAFQIYDGTAAAERMRIDSSGTVIVNNGGAGNGLIKINGATGNTEAIIFQRGGTEASRIGHSNSADLTFSTGSSATERMRIDTSGNLLVGKTSASSATVGFQAGQDGFIAATRTSSEPLVLNRLTSDGLIASFRKDGAQVGSIGATSGRLYIGDGDVALRFSDDLDFISPWDASTNAARDGAIDLGNAGNRFKDIYLSGGVYVGGTGAANKLDDYEEGTFTATLRGGTSEPGTLITTTGRYTKIGNTVHIRIGYENVDTTGYSGGMSVEGCPFTNSSSARAQLSVGHYQTTTWSTTEIPIAQLGISATTIILQNTVSGNVWTSNIHNAGTSRFMWITGAYEAA